MWTVERAGDGQAGHYRILFAGNALTVDHASMGSGALATAAPWRGGDHQIWNGTGHPSGGYRLTAKHSGLVLDSAGDVTPDGTTVVQSPWNSGRDQAWYAMEIQLEGVRRRA
ncbi:RICIN domain-containing protein [Kitasatospora sp. NPDC059646]|uniref:RICIN domain-containing protein n=1 Tax=Kitasatospora sp. NPDC059646 TaxID=3346893 RepID=UPI0036A28AAE